MSAWFAPLFGLDVLGVLLHVGCVVLLTLGIVFKYQSDRRYLLSGDRLVLVHHRAGVRRFQIELDRVELEFFVDRILVDGRRLPFMVGPGDAFRDLTSALHRS